MDIQTVQLPRRETLADLFMQDFARVKSLYTYPPYQEESYRDRLNDIVGNRKQADRSALVAALHTYNERVNPHPAVRDHIDLLQHPDCAVVVGGQQAGVLTGPLYTIHKAITIIQLARQKSERLGVPVVPVFWIAGEDHDLAEVDHVMVQQTDHHLSRLRIKTNDSRKLSVGHRRLQSQEVDMFLKEVADAHADTPFKGLWMNRLRELANQSDTFSDWFARIFHWLFATYGLVLIDTADAEFKKVMVPFFIQVIERNETLNDAFVKAADAIRELGFQPQVETQVGQANLFIYEHGERLLLTRQGDQFMTKDGQVTYSANELIKMAQNNPERLSTNVLTRPLLQEFLFPTLATVLGNAEIAYWGLGREAFRLFGWRMPILFPRVGFTLVEPNIAKSMVTFGLDAVEAMFHVQKKREQWLKGQDDIGVEGLFADLRQDLAERYQLKTAPLLSFNQGMKDLIAKNQSRILREVDYLEKQAHSALRVRHEAFLSQFDQIEQGLQPEGALQERVYNVFFYVNRYGWDWLRTLLREPIDLTRQHYFVYL